MPPPQNMNDIMSYKIIVNANQNNEYRLCKSLKSKLNRSMEKLHFILPRVKQTQGKATFHL